MTRGSGVLLHVSSLPGGYGIGNIGGAALEFIDFLGDCGQRYWQFLPLGPTSKEAADSPYMSYSALAGNPLFIDLDDLVENGLVSRQELAGAPKFSEYQVDYRLAPSYIYKILETAFHEFSPGARPPDFGEFRRSEPWLAEYALFMALKEANHFQPWYQWPGPIIRRNGAELMIWREKLADRIDFYCFCQYYFFRQWSRLKSYANKKGVLLIGDIPIYVSPDSVDVWANPDCFHLDPVTMNPTQVAGVPPDYFSATGQRWGNPLYRWEVADGINQRLYDWWGERFRSIAKYVDVCRIDHFRGFESFWEIDFAEETAVHGRWVKGPGRAFFDNLAGAIGGLPIIAEDLGLITPEVEELREVLGFPGMKVLQFAFDSDQTNPYLPHNYQSDNAVVYTGTHDNDTTLGWFTGSQISAATRKRVKRYLGRDGTDISHDFIRLALSSSARIAILPMQDILGFGNDCRMNTPGTVTGNWQWRCAARFFDRGLAEWLRDETSFYNRV